VREQEPDAAAKAKAAPPPNDAPPGFRF
jgi:hypothetical protein